MTKATQQTDEQPVDETPKAPVVAFADKEFAAGKDFPLKRALTVDGKPLKSIHIPRRSVGELAPVLKALNGEGGMASMVGAYVDLHPAIIAGLDPDDASDLEAAVTDFLPRKVQQAIADFKTALASGNGDKSAPSSPTGTNGD